MENNLSNYELALVIHPDQNEDQRGKLVELIEKFAKQHKGQVTKREDSGKTLLAYPISKQNEARYFYLNLELPSEAVPQLDAKLRVEESLLRHLILKK